MSADPPPIETVRPATVTELGDVVRRAAENGLGLFPRGGGTHSHIGYAPAKPGFAVDMTAMDQVIDYPARDMTITVQAGITLAKLQAILAAENQRLPIDVAEPERATLGGAIAVNASGPRRFGFGTLRDYVIGISFTNDEGNEVKAGGRVVKNVAGYDLCKLQIGAFGTLGIITQVTLKLKPLPEDAGLAIISCRADDVAGLLTQIHGSQTRPVCVELRSSPGPEWTLAVGFEDNRDALAWQLGQIQKELGALNLRTYSGEDARREWPTVLSSAARLSFKANVLPSALTEFLERLLDFPEIVWQAHAGNGIVIGNCVDDLTLERARQMLTALRVIAVRAQGNLVVTRCPTEWKRELNIWGVLREDLALMRAVKRELDPKDLFNPGRFLV